MSVTGLNLIKVIISKFKCTGINILNIKFHCRYVSENEPLDTVLGPIGPQLPSEYPSLSPHIPVNYQAIPTFNITWNENEQSHVSFPEDENSILPYEPEIEQNDFATNDIPEVDNENTIVHLNTNDIQDDTNLLVDGFWINDGIKIFSV